MCKSCSLKLTKLSTCQKRTWSNIADSYQVSNLLRVQMTPGPRRNTFLLSDFGSSNVERSCQPKPRDPAALPSTSFLLCLEAVRDCSKLSKWRIGFFCLSCLLVAFIPYILPGNFLCPYKGRGMLRDLTS